MKNLNVINVEGKKKNVENSFLLQPDSNLNTASLLKDLVTCIGNVFSWSVQLYERRLK